MNKNKNTLFSRSAHIRTHTHTTPTRGTPAPINAYVCTHIRMHAHTRTTHARTLPLRIIIILTQTVHENRIYSLKIHCGDQYPDVPPTIQFVSRVNLPFVSQTDGKVDKTKLPVLANWHRNHSIETVLVEIRRSAPPPSSISAFCSSPYFVFREMASFSNRKLPQPPEGSTF